MTDDELQGITGALTIGEFFDGETGKVYELSNEVNENTYAVGCVVGFFYRNVGMQGFVIGYAYDEARCESVYNVYISNLGRFDVWQSALDEFDANNIHGLKNPIGVPDKMTLSWGSDDSP